ncbi:TlpA disulfide reductase family protein [Mucilaginibacter sp.]|uniref:TlpA disulfide reductase family protein n=1 Tax=Mucilaginibacter sp. TaxID=1882438 RepID=UPI00283BA02B|nr:TlpA disulfide reductase family protein [Mucilaginibacter sp.]MDR3696965.1 TlpA disulfide reductase family protein [Mucilaginibacter sp.]
MKRIILGFLLLSQVVVFAQPGKYAMKGKIGSLNKPATVYLLYNQMIADSAVLKNGEFSFIGSIDQPTAAYLTLNKAGNGFTSDNYIRFYLETGGIINVASSDTLANAKITGTKNNDDNEKYVAMMAPIERRDGALETMDTSATEAQKSSPQFLKELELLNKDLEKERKAANKKFIIENPSSLVSLFALSSFANYSDYNEVSMLFDKLSPSVKNSARGKSYAQTLEKMHNVSVGSIAPDFTLPDTTNTRISLSSFKGKYLLLDFWASWCPICRESAPGVLKAYNSYHNRGFNILSVSLDKPGDRQKWLQAIHHDGLLWPQVSDLKFWYSPVVSLYKLTALPQNFLIDPNGKIIARDLDSEELSAKLVEIFGSKP